MGKVFLVRHLAPKLFVCHSRGQDPMAVARATGHQRRNKKVSSPFGFCTGCLRPPSVSGTNACAARRLGTGVQVVTGSSMSGACHTVLRQIPLDRRQNFHYPCCSWCEAKARNRSASPAPTHGARGSHGCVHIVQCILTGSTSKPHHELLCR